MDKCQHFKINPTGEVEEADLPTGYSPAGITQWPKDTWLKRALAAAKQIEAIELKGGEK